MLTTASGTPEIPERSVLKQIFFTSNNEANLTTASSGCIAFAISGRNFRKRSCFSCGLAGLKLEGGRSLNTCTSIFHSDARCAFIAWDTQRWASACLPQNFSCLFAIATYNAGISQALWACYGNDQICHCVNGYHNSRTHSPKILVYTHMQSTTWSIAILLIHMVKNSWIIENRKKENRPHLFRFCFCRCLRQQCSMCQHSSVCCKVRFQVQY